MFTVGKTYEIETCEYGENGYESTKHFTWKVVEVKMPVVKLFNGEEEWILNVSSPLFVGAKRQQSN